MRTLFLLLFVSSVFNLSAQEMMSVLKPMMTLSDSSETGPVNQEGVYTIPPKEARMAEQFYDENGICAVLLYDADGAICKYTAGETNDDSYILLSASWSKSQLVHYEIEGPYSYYRSWYRDTSGTIRIIYRTEASGGYTIVMDPMHNIIEHGVYDTTNLTLAFKYYYPNGQMKEQYIDYWPRKDLKVGVHKTFDEKGNLTMEGYYLTYHEIEEGEIDYAKYKGGVKHGSWKYYKDGNLIKTEHWVNGELESAQSP